MSFYGKVYTLESQENFEEFLNAFGDIPAEYKKAILAHVPTLTVTKDGDDYVLKTSKPGGDIVYKFKSGVEFDDTLNNNPVKTTITVDGNTITQVQKAGNGITITIKRTFNGNELVATVTGTGFNGAAKRVYKVK